MPFGVINEIAFLEIFCFVSPYLLGQELWRLMLMNLRVDRPLRFLTGPNLVV